MAKLSQAKIEFEDRLENLFSTTEIAFDNASFDQGNDPWIRAVMIPTVTENAAIGSSRLYNGLFWVQVFVKVGIGAKLAYEIAEEVETIFSNQKFNGVVCYASEITRTGNEGKGWFQLNVKTPFWSHELN